jgi:hypothetical protein
MTDNTQTAHDIVDRENELAVLRGTAAPGNLRAFIREEINKVLAEIRKSDQRQDQRISNLEKMIG